MKNSCGIWLMIACSFLIVARANAMPFDDGDGKVSSSNSDGEHSAREVKSAAGMADEGPAHHASNTANPVMPARLARPKHLGQAANHHAKLSQGDSAVVRQPPSGTSAGPGVPLARSNMPPDSPFSVRPPRAVSRPSTLSNTVRHHGTNSPTVGGATNAKAVNAGTINGTGVHRKP